jgi:ankyrin repeat protein
MKSFPKSAAFSFLKASRLAAILLMALVCTSLAFAGPIHDAARKGDVKKVRALLQGDPKLLNDKDNQGNTPLQMDDHKWADVLRKKGAHE